MANPQHVKTPRLNALLIGKRTVPSGCRVVNVSQQGMSLQCDPDGRLLTFRSGDSVDIFLSVQHASGHNRFTIPAIISHVDESVIDVVFHCTDTELAGLIESYRTSETHNLEAKIDHRSANRPDTTIRPADLENTSDVFDEADNIARSNWSFYTGLLVLFGTSLLLLGAYYYISTLNSRLDYLEVTSRSHTEELAEIQSQAFSSRLQDGRYASLNARMKALTDAFQSFEQRMSTALVAPSTALPTEPGLHTDTETTLIPEQAETKVESAAAEPIAASEPATPARKKPAVERVKSPATAEPVEDNSPSVDKYPVIETTEGKLAVPAYQLNQAATPVNPPPVQNATATTGATETAVDTEPQQAIKLSRQLISTPPEPAPASAVEEEPVKTGSTTTSTDTVQVTAASSKPASKTPSTEPADKLATGPWVINLLSSPSKSYVEKMHTKVSRDGFNVDVTSAEVKGKQYWRLQSAGFKSMSAAKTAAAPMKESLNIKDVWIFKR